MNIQKNAYAPFRRAHSGNIKQIIIIPLILNFNMKTFFIILTAFGVLAITAKTFAQPGSLDLSFSTDGKTTIGFAAHSEATCTASARQADGKLVVGGYISNGTDFDFALLRYNTNGSPDTSFSSDGKVTSGIGNTSQYCTAIAIQADGKIVAAGYSFNGSTTDFAVFRYNTNGSPDNTFSSDGIVTTNMINLYAQANSVAIQADGKIVVAGSVSTGLNMDFAVIRYNSNGSLDNSFSLDGIVVSTIGSFDEGANSVAIQGDGKIVVAGYSWAVDHKNIGIIRYNPDGSPDNTFSLDGKLTTEVSPSGNSDARAVVIQNGKILVAGYADIDPTAATDNEFALVRYNANGTPDNTFDIDGKLIISPGGLNEVAHSVALQPDGKILVAGQSSNAFAIIRCNSNGAIDNSFSLDGKLITAITGFSVARSLALQADGKIMLSGYCALRSEGGIVGQLTFTTIRYFANGTPDNSFGSNGIAISEFRGSKAAVDAGNVVAVQPDGKIIVAGNSNNGNYNDLVMVRFLPNGRLDNSFNISGKVYKVFFNDFSANAVALQQDEKILVAGSLFNGANLDFALLRYNADGTQDNTFSSDGLVTTPIGNSNDAAYSVAVQADGKILVAGYSNNGSNVDIALVRYNSDGTLDNFFNLDGKATTDFGSRDNYGTSLAIQPDGKIVVAGYSYNGSNNDFAVARYKTNGDLDPTFNNLTGKVTTNISNNDYGSSVAIQADGKIVVAGNSYNGTDRDFSVVRYNANGTPDNSFSNDAKQLTTIDGTSVDFAKSVKIEQSGKIIVGGYSYKNSSNKYDLALVRYSQNGVPDETFGFNGRIITDFNLTDDYANSIAIQQDGKLIVAGTSNNDFAVARYLLSSSAPQSGTLEAEQALLNGAVVASNQPGFTGTGFADYVNASGDYIEWTLNASLAGSFTLKFRYANGSAANRPLKLQVNGVEVVASLAFSPTGAWATWSVSSASANLIGGNNKIRLTTTGSNGPNVDHLAFSSNPSFQSVQGREQPISLVPLSVEVLEAQVTPNPVTANAKLKISTTSGLPIDLGLFDMSGRSLRSIKFSLKGTNTFDFPVNDLPAGTYTIFLKQGTLSTNARLIVAR